ncbi:MAG TPA: hypothetical protein VEH51_11580 [Burkholderiales bacterium]|nr:hypothetical protein [Burkholderiales bacterium]
MQGAAPGIVAAESVTSLGGVAGKVLVAGSHGGVLAACLGARAGAHAIILNDAGLGKERAGIAGLAWLEEFGIAAASVSHASARIGDGADMLRRGVISHVNVFAAFAGVRAGQACREAAERLRGAPAPRARPAACAAGRHLLLASQPEVWGLDSVGMLEPGDAGRVLVIGSHGALHGGRPESALGVDARAAVFHDAGVGADHIGVSRLAPLQARDIPAATVDFRSARIGDCRSLWDNGVLSHVNACAARSGARAGESVRAFAAHYLCDPTRSSR